MRSQGRPNVPAVGQFDDGPDGEIDPGMATDAGAIVSQGGVLAKTQAGYSTAISVQRPRERKAIQKAVLEEAELAGEDFFYSWTTKNKDGTRGLVEGLSIEGAMILARNWGNCAIPTELLVDAPQHWILSATFVDLETGFNVPRLFRQRKGQRSGGMDQDRALDIAFQIGQSKAQRNAIDKAMPNWLKEAALEKARGAVEGRFKDLPAANQKAIGGFGAWGITQKQLEEKLGIPMSAWTARDHVSLSGLYRAIKDRQTTLAEEFPKEQPPVAAPHVEQPAASPARDAYGGDQPAPAPAAAAPPPPASAAAPAAPPPPPPPADPAPAAAPEKPPAPPADNPQPEPKQPGRGSKKADREPGQEG